MTLWNLLIAICGLCPLFVGLSEGATHGCLGIILGVVLGIAVGVVACVLAFKLWTFAVSLLLRQRAHPKLQVLLSTLMYAMLVAWILLAGGVTKWLVDRTAQAASQACGLGKGE